MSLPVVYGYFAIMSAVLTVGTFITGLPFFAKRGKWGRINDVVSILQLASMVPLVIVGFISPDAYYILASLIGLVLGTAGLVIAGLFQTLLVSGVMPYEKSSSVSMPAGILNGRERHYLFTGGSIVAMTGYCAWAIRLGVIIFQ